MEKGSQESTKTKKSKAEYQKWMKTRPRLKALDI
jgi:hypothetical protein